MKGKINAQKRKFEKTYICSVAIKFFLHVIILVVICFSFVAVKKKREAADRLFMTISSSDYSPVGSFTRSHLLFDDGRGGETGVSRFA